MCGFVLYQGENIAPEHLNESLDNLSHRGPDDRDIYINDSGTMGIGHCRLSIIDLKKGRQPMSQSGNVLAYNGEIYNYREIRNDLKDRGHSFETESDTEVLLKSYREWGVECLGHFRGMFAFAIWDEIQDRILLARDRFGQKPLFYTQKNSRFYASSEIQTLVQFPDVERKVSLESIPLYLGLQYIPSPKSGFRDIQKLSPAHYMIVEGGSITKRERYWDLSHTPKLNINYQTSKKRVRETVRESVRLRMRSDVPLGAFLSGGIDSSIIVAVMSEFTSKPIRTFSIGFDHDDFNELTFARSMAERYNTDHHEYKVSARVQDLLPDLVKHYGEPFADSSSIPVYYVSRETSREVKVALTGDGGDELFAGYSLYQFFQPRDILKSWLPKLLTSALSKFSQFIPHSDRGRGVLNKAFLFSDHLNQDAGSWYYFLASYFGMDQLRSILKNTELLNQNSPRGFCRNEFQKLSNIGTETEQAMAFDARNYLPEDLLFKVDIASMMNSLECRSPLVDHKLAELAAQIPLKHKLNWGKSSKKKLLKDAFKEKLPAEVLKHQKTGFGIPRSRWLRQDLEEFMKELLLHPSDIFSAILNTDRIHSMMDAHESGKADYGSQLWALLILELWIREMNVKL